jgi:hypothetical protein
MRKYMLTVAAVAALTASLAVAAQKASRPARVEVAPTRPVDVPKGTAAERRAEALRDASSRADIWKYKGARVSPHPEAKGEALEAQRRIAALMTRLDYVPAHRVEQFRFFTDNGWQTITGWSVEILDATPVAGGTRVTVKVWAQFASGLGTGVHTIEQYLVSTNGLHHVGSVAPPASRVSTLN